MPHAVIWALQQERLRFWYSLQKGDAVSLLPGVYASLGKDAKGEGLLTVPVFLSRTGVFCFMSVLLWL